MKYKLHQEYNIVLTGYNTTFRRLAVPGGWLYLFATSSGNSLQFVSDATVEIEQ